MFPHVTQSLTQNSNCVVTQSSNSSQIFVQNPVTQSSHRAFQHCAPAQGDDLLRDFDANNNDTQPCYTSSQSNSYIQKPVTQSSQKPVTQSRPIGSLKLYTKTQRQCPNELLYFLGGAMARMQIFMLHVTCYMSV